MSDGEDTLFLMLNSKSMGKIDPDYLRMAVGFLDTDKLMEVGAYKTFVALVSLTDGKLQKQRQFQMPVRDVMREIGISTNNYEALRDYVKTLMETVLDFNLHRQDNNPGWRMAQILGPSELKNGIISFEFTEPVWEKLKDPIIYAYITRKGVYAFKSKYEIALYNWFTRLLVPNHDNVIVEESIQFVLQDILHIEKKSLKTYGSYMRLNDKILKKSIEYINENTNLLVKYDGLREGRTVTRIRFLIARQKPTADDAQQHLPKPIAEALKRLVKLGLSLDAKIEQRVTALLTELGEDFCAQRLVAIAKEVQSRADNFKNPGGYIRTKLFEDILLPETVTEQAQPQQEFIERYQQFLQQAFKSLWSAFAFEHFKLFMAEHFEALQPRILKLFSADKPFQALTKRETLTKQSLLNSKSLLTVVMTQADELGFVMPETPQQTWLAEHQDAILVRARELLKLDLALEREMQEAKCSFQEVEQSALRQFVLQSETLAVPAS